MPGFSLGKRLAPPRFLLFLALLVAGWAAGIAALDLAEGVMAGFDLAALVFLLSCVPLLDDAPAEMRAAAVRNDANRAVLLAITGAVIVVLMVAVASELAKRQAPGVLGVSLIIATLVIAWLFSNLIYALHYAHLFYSDGAGGKDCGGLDVPGTEEPTYWDFAYFAFTLGMTFQTSDVEIRSGAMRRVAIFHCFAAFVFNIGVLAFTINVLGGR